MMRPIDERITMWCRMFGHPVAYAWPSLLDHDDDLPRRTRTVMASIATVAASPGLSEPVSDGHRDLLPSSSKIRSMSECPCCKRPFEDESRPLTTVRLAVSGAHRAGRRCAPHSCGRHCPGGAAGMDARQHLRQHRGNRGRGRASRYRDREVGHAQSAQDLQRIRVAAHWFTTRSADAATPPTTSRSAAGAEHQAAQALPTTSAAGCVCWVEQVSLRGALSRHLHRHCH